MCYDVAQLALKMYREAKRLNASEDEIEHLRKRWEELAKGGDPNLYHANGYNHPDIAVIGTDESGLTIDRHSWGLIPHWVRSLEQAKEIQNKTLNARGETMFEKPSFKDSAHNNRVIIPLDGFFEHHHKHGKTFPYFIKRKDNQRLLVAGLSSKWMNPENNEGIESTTIVTTRGNEVMTFIHNNPKLKEPRMPLVLNDDDCIQWLNGNEREVQELVKPNDEIELETTTVKRLRGKAYVGNSSEVQEEFYYPELVDPPTLF